MIIKKIRSLALSLIITSLVFVGVVPIASADTIASNSYSLTTSLSKSNPVVNESLNINLNLSTVGNGVSNGIFQVQVFNSNNVKILSKNYTAQTINSATPHSYSLPLTPTSTGDYYVKAGVFSSDWSSNPFWTSKAVAFKVGNPVVSTNQYSLTTSLSKSNPVVNESLNINLNLSTVGNGVSNGIFQVQVFNSNNVKILSKNYTAQTINSATPHSYSLPLTPTSTGDYYVKAGVFSSDWSSNPFWTSKAIAFKVGQGQIIPTPEPTPTTGGYGLNKNINLQEAGSITSSPDSNWWLNSGAYFSVVNGVGKTYQGSLPTTDLWNQLYKVANPVDTDNGVHPQNLFRLITKSKFKDFSQEAYFKINKYNLSNSDQRYESNGFLFFNRYVDAYNLYYTGLRVDGTAVIKKKIAGRYYTMSQKKVFPGTYNHETNPNILPTDHYIGLKSVVTDLADGSVSIKVYVDKDGTGSWTLALDALDTGANYGPKIQASASAGIRTDFMDAEFKDYKINNL